MQCVFIQVMSHSAYLGIRPGASVCSVWRPCWICIRACMARGLVMTDSASGFCIWRQMGRNGSRKLGKVTVSN